MQQWVVVFREPYDAWAATTDDNAVRIVGRQVLAWMVERIDGPPSYYRWIEAKQLFEAAIEAAGVVVEFKLLEGLDPPAFVTRLFREADATS